MTFASNVNHAKRPVMPCVVRVYILYLYGISCVKPTTLKTLKGVFFVVAGKRYSSLQFCMGKVEEKDGVATFELTLPIARKRILTVIGNEALGYPNMTAVYVTRYLLVWGTRKIATLDLKTKPVRSVFKLLKAKAVKKQRTEEPDGNDEHHEVKDD